MAAALSPLPPSRPRGAISSVAGRPDAVVLIALRPRTLGLFVPVRDELALRVRRRCAHGADYEGKLDKISPIFPNGFVPQGN